MHVEIKNLNHNLGEGTRAEDINIVIQRGDLIGFLGPKCSGKTTILKMIAGLETPCTGDIYIDGVRINDMEKAQRRVSYISSKYILYRFMTVYENISMSMEYKDVIKAKKDRKVLEILRILDIKGLENLYPHQLTEEEKKLVVIAKEAAANPKLLLFDEPFAAVDNALRADIRSRVKTLINKLGLNGIMAMNSIDDALDIVNRFVLARADMGFGLFEKRA